MIANPSSRRDHVRLEEFLTRLRAAQIDIVPMHESEPTAMRRFIQRTASDYSLAVVAGGDGTLHRAVGALRGTELPVGVLPLGTANDFARGLELPFDPGGAADVIVAGVRTSVDLGLANETPFLNAVQLGLGVAVTRRLSTAVKSRWGVLGYARSVVVALASLEAFRIEVRAEGVHEWLYAVHVTIGNGRYYGGGMAVAPNAELDDGRLQLFSIEPAPMRRLARLLPALARGRQGEHHGVFACSGSWLYVDTARPMPFTVDGELSGRTPLRLGVLRRALDVFVPERWESARLERMGGA